MGHQMGGSHHRTHTAEKHGLRGQRERKNDIADRGERNDHRRTERCIPCFQSPVGAVHTPLDLGTAAIDRIHILESGTEPVVDRIRIAKDIVPKSDVKHELVSHKNAKAFKEKIKCVR